MQGNIFLFPMVQSLTTIKLQDLHYVCALKMTNLKVTVQSTKFLKKPLIAQNATLLFGDLAVT